MLLDQVAAARLRPLERLLRLHQQRVEEQRVLREVARQADTQRHVDAPPSRLQLELFDGTAHPVGGDACAPELGVRQDPEQPLVGEPPQQVGRPGARLEEPGHLLEEHRPRFFAVEIAQILESIDAGDAERQRVAVATRARELLLREREALAQRQQRYGTGTKAHRGAARAPTAALSTSESHRIISLVAGWGGYARRQNGERVEGGERAGTERKDRPARNNSGDSCPRNSCSRNRQAPLARTPAGLVNCSDRSAPSPRGRRKGGSAAGWGGRLGRGVPQPAAATRVSIGILGSKGRQAPKHMASRELGSCSRAGVPPPQLGAFGLDASPLGPSCGRCKRPFRSRPEDGADVRLSVPFLEPPQSTAQRAKRAPRQSPAARTGMVPLCPPLFNRLSTKSCTALRSPGGARDSAGSGC